MPFWRQQLRKEISLAQVIPEWGLRLLHPHPLPQTLLLMQPIGTLSKGMPEPAATNKNMPNL